MRIPLNQFEQYIDETILKRGLSYFKKGYVSEPEEITPGVYEAIVSGSEDYTVELKIQNEIVVEHTCSCPYDMGPVCKHIVAVLFCLQQDVLALKTNVIPLHRTKEKSLPPKNKKKSVTEQVNELLKRISHDELKQFVREKAALNPSFRNLFLASFAHQSTHESKEVYAKQVKSILRAAVGKEGFIYWNQVGNVSKQVNELLAIAQRQFDNKNFKSVFFSCTAVMEEMTAALQFSDDSNGYIGGCIDFAFGLLSALTEEKLPEEIRTQLFKYSISSFEKQIFSGWDWHAGVLQIAAKILADEEEAQRLTACLDSVKHSDYTQEEAQRIKLQVIRKTKGEKEAEKFIHQNLSNPQLRREAIRRALQDKAYEKAITISKDGIKQDGKDRPGLAKEWYDWLLKIAQAQEDKAKIIEYARLLFMNNFRQEQDYYQLLKNNVPEETWNVFLEELIKDISARKGWSNFELITQIYVSEKWWSRLLKLIQQNSSLNHIEHYEKYLSKDFAAELVALYKTELITYLQKNTGRNHYQIVCRYLRRMIKLGGRETVDHIVSDFRKQYPQRRALMEELNKI